MERRNFLKLVAAAVVCPKGLLTEEKKPCKHEWRLYGPNLFDDCRCCLCGIKGDPKDAIIPWKNYTTTYTYELPTEKQRLVEKMRRALKNTKFKSPTRPVIYFRGMRIHYRTLLYV